MKTRLREFVPISIGIFGRIRTASRAVKAAVTIEVAAGLVAALLAWAGLRSHVLGLIDLDNLPPWHALVACPVVGAAAVAVRAWRPDQALRRWHGVALRRIDERWG
jgi:hypothetical protein